MRLPLVTRYPQGIPLPAPVWGALRGFSRWEAGQVGLTPESSTVCRNIQADLPTHLGWSSWTPSVAFSGTKAIHVRPPHTYWRYPRLPYTYTPMGVTHTDVNGETVFRFPLAALKIEEATCAYSLFLRGKRRRWAKLNDHKNILIHYGSLWRAIGLVSFPRAAGLTRY